MSKDGPPISGGKRYGGMEALRAGLPPNAIKPRSVITNEDLQARKNLADFAAYPARAKSIGIEEPSADKQDISEERAAALQKMQKLGQQQPVEHRVQLWAGMNIVFNDERNRWFFLKTDLETGTVYKSFYSYSSREIAMNNIGRVKWIRQA